MPITTRLVGLTVRVDRPWFGYSPFAEHLHHLIPTLPTFRISTNTPRLHILEFPSDIRNIFFTHSKKLGLDLEGILFYKPLSVPNIYLQTLPLHPRIHILTELATGEHEERREALSFESDKDAPSLDTAATCSPDPDVQDGN